jgi:hypothetical protein
VGRTLRSLFDGTKAMLMTFYARSSNPFLSPILVVYDIYKWGRIFNKSIQINWLDNPPRIFCAMAPIIDRQKG